MPKNQRLRAGFTMIEILVTIVIITILVGLLLPVLARAKEAGRITQCKSNLKQLGMAIITYSGDYGERSPATYGWYDWPTTGEPQQWDRADTRVSSYALFVPSGPYRSTTGVDAVATGLGLLWSSGVLSTKGAKIYYCPSARHQSLGDTVTVQVRSKWHYDREEPVWAAARLNPGDIEAGRMPDMAARLSNRNGEGDMGDTGSTPVDPESNSGFQEYGDAVLTNYWLRTRASSLDGNANHYKIDQSRTYNSWRLNNEMDSTFKGALVSDFIGGDWQIARWLGSGSGVTAPNIFIQNHDAVYNVLFKDGSVQTFSDGSSKVKKMLQDILAGRIPGANTNLDLMCDTLSATVFPAYFDQLRSSN